MTSRSRSTWTEQEKQTQPMSGEADPQEALAKALKFAAMERLRTKSRVPAPNPGAAVRPGTAK